MPQRYVRLCPVEQVPEGDCPIVDRSVELGYISSGGSWGKIIIPLLAPLAGGTPPAPSSTSPPSGTSTAMFGGDKSCLCVAIVAGGGGARKPHLQFNLILFSAT